MHVKHLLDLPNGWTKALVNILLVCTASLVFFFDSWASIIEIWLRSSTYTHGFVIAPISFWLIASRRRYYLQLSPTVSWLALTAVVVSGFLWLCADLSQILVVKQLATVSMLLSGVWFVLGNSVVFSMAFPLFFLFFMVPMGEELVPLLIEFTTTFTVKMIRLSGLPVYREGHSFILTSGTWSVVEACSGISYLIASITLGFVFAYLNFAYYWKRAVFMLLSCLVPIVANGFRAYMIAMIGHLSDMTLAVGVDHLVYGGIFFGIVMLLLFYLGSFWRDPPFTPISIIANTAVRQTSRENIWLLLPAVIVLIGIWPLLSSWLANKQVHNQLPAYVATSGFGKWQMAVDPIWSWQPYFPLAVDHNSRFYTDGKDTVGIYHAGFGKEVQGAELVNASNTLVNQADGHNIKKINLESIKIQDGNSRQFDINATVLKVRGTSIYVMDWYQIGDWISSNSYEAKWRQLLKRLTGRISPESKVVIWIQTDQKDYLPAGQVLKSFLMDWLKQPKVLSGH